MPHLHQVKLIRVQKFHVEAPPHEAFPYRIGWGSDCIGQATEITICGVVHVVPAECTRPSFGGPHVDWQFPADARKRRRERSLGAHPALAAGRTPLPHNSANWDVDWRPANNNPDAYLYMQIHKGLTP